MSFLFLDTHPPPQPARGEAPTALVVSTADEPAKAKQKKKKKKKEKPPVDARVFATPVSSARQFGGVSAKTKLVIPANATRFAQVALGVPTFQGHLDRLLAFTGRQSGTSFLSGVISCAPWLGAFAMLIMGNGVGVAACLGSTGVVRTVRQPRSGELPVTPAILETVKKAYADAATDADPMGAVALRHSLVNALQRAKHSRGLCPEAEIYLQDLRYTTIADSEIEGAGTRAAQAAEALRSGSSTRAFPELHPFEAVSLAAIHPRPAAGNHDATWQLVRVAGERAQEQIDEAVSADIERRLNPEER